MDFQRFPSLINTYKEKEIQRATEEDKVDGVWVVSEKLDGANFSFWCGGDEVRVASRNQWVDGTFYGCQPVIDKYVDLVANIYRATCKPEDTLAIFGELYGDGIQDRVKYGEKNFNFFEVQLNGTPLPHGMHMLIAEAGLPYIPILAAGDLQSALDFDENFKSHRTPEGVEGENPAEGIVIAPWEPRWLASGKRVIYKKKSEKFQEKKERKPKTPPVPLSDNDQCLLTVLLQYNTESRVYSVISKIGEITNKDFGRIMGLTTKDLLEEWAAVESGNLKTTAEDYKQVSRVLKKEVSDTVRSVFLKIV